MKEWERDEEPWERAKRLAWKASLTTDPAIGSTPEILAIAEKRLAVLTWISENPAPNDWDGDALDWAYLEMPFPPGGGGQQ
jgi:hypothetical protein